MKKSEIGKEFEQYITKEGKEYTDNRTTLIDNVPHLYPAWIGEHSLRVVCPYCKKLHTHGLCDDKQYQGHRVSDCLNGSSVYVIERI